MIGRNEDIPIFRKDIIASIGLFLDPKGLWNFAVTCKHVYKYIALFWRSVHANSFLTLKYLSGLDFKLLSRFLDRFFWDNIERENKLITEIDKSIVSLPARALYSLFAPSDYIKSHVIELESSIQFLILNDFYVNSALMKSLLFLVNVSKGRFNNYALIPRQDIDFHINLRGAQLNHVQLQSYDLAYANLSDASCVGTDFAKARLSHANLRRATLDCANLRGTLLMNANLSFARLRKAPLLGASLYNANLCNTDLLFSEMKVKPFLMFRPLWDELDEMDFGETGTELTGCLYNSKTRFPQPISKRNNGMVKKRG